MAATSANEPLKREIHEAIGDIYNQKINDKQYKQPLMVGWVMQHAMQSLDTGICSSRTMGSSPPPCTNPFTCLHLACRICSLSADTFSR